MVRLQFESESGASQYFMHRLIFIGLISISLTAHSLAAAEDYSYASPEPIMLPTGFAITPMSAPESKFELLNPRLPNFPRFVASGAAAMAVSPDQRTLLVLTSGYNRNNNLLGKLDSQASQQYVFVYDIAGGRPERKQVLVKNRKKPRTVSTEVTVLSQRNFQSLEISPRVGGVKFQGWRNSSSK
jgi:hypothetical protein